MQQPFSEPVCSRLVDGVERKSHGLFHVKIKCFTEQSFLVPKSGVEAGAVNAYGFGQIRQRGAFIAFLPEDAERSIVASIGMEAFSVYSATKAGVRPEGVTLSCSGFTLDADRSDPPFPVARFATDVKTGDDQEGTEFLLF